MGFQLGLKVHKLCMSVVCMRRCDQYTLCDYVPLWTVRFVTVIRSTCVTVRYMCSRVWLCIGPCVLYVITWFCILWLYRSPRMYLYVRFYA